MVLRDKVIDYLKTYKKNTISLNQLANILSGQYDYLDFASTINILIEEGILRPIKSHGTNGRAISLHNGYRITRSKLREDLNNEIRQKSLKFDPHINLDGYYSLHEKEWKEDYIYIKKLDSYLKKKGLPDSYLTAPERSFQLVGNEKWIEEEGGRRLLERLKLWDKFKIMIQPDPLMFSINPKTINKSSHFHLVVENKTTFYNLMGYIDEAKFTSLIYGAGWRITANIQSLPLQLGLKENTHKIYYFGDLDPEGISIWYSLYKSHNIHPALPFYKSLLKKTFSIGKEGQQKNLEAINKFKDYFSIEDRLKIGELFKIGGYLPQEALDKKELKDIWRNEEWQFP